MTGKLTTVVTALLLIGAAASGCRSVLGVHELSDDGISEGGPETGTDATAATDSWLPDVTLREGSQEADGIGVTDASLTEEGACSPGGTCTPAECQIGSYECFDGGMQCAKTGNVSDGVSCGLSSGHVCHLGVCVACAVGTDCTPTNSCQKMTNDCSSGVGVCSPAGNVNDGTPCGTNLFCSNGVCTTCIAGSDCSPAANPCNAGKIACAQGAAVCVDQHAPAVDGRSCGLNRVCCAGACIITNGSDASNCGACGLKCASGTSCSAGHCVCSTSSGCNGCCKQGATCVPLGQEGNSACGSGGGVCTDCTTKSSTGETTCSIQGTCACASGSLNDVNNCGRCGNVCLSKEQCFGGTCACATGTLNDNGNCGSCGHACSGLSCFGGFCGCSTSVECPVGQACDPASHTCSTSCDGVSVKCNGGCCSNGVCVSGLGATSTTPCGSGGVQCASSCVLGACDQFSKWNGGSCECDQDSRCLGNPTGPRCVGDAANGAGVCGCLSDADCGSNKCNLVGADPVGFPGGYCN